MAANTFGKIFRLTSFGESHGSAIGGIIDGCPPGVEVDFDFLQNELNRRKPDNSFFTSDRKEDDSLKVLSGVFQGKTTGTPIAFFVENKDAKSHDYNSLKEVFRPSHADFTYYKKYGVHDYRGGGRASARETLSRIVAGAFAKLVLKKYNIKIFAFTKQIGDIKFDDDYKKIQISDIEKSFVRCPDADITKKMLEYLKSIKKEGDTCGGIVKCIINGVEPGLGEPVFDKLQADLAKAMLSINAAKGFEYGSGFNAASMKGSENNDLFNKDLSTKTNFSGGIQGGISNGQDIYFNVAFKPVPTIMKPQLSYDKNGKEVVISPKGRHDVCCVPRAIPIVEAMAAIVILDHLLRFNNYRVIK
ncbi:MAG: chorismate synthase [Bacteroidales bacterium]|nr:chorismate synthase [Bacteroidales bacterium]